MPEAELPRYRHTVDITLNKAERLTRSERLQLLLTVLAQWQRVSLIHEVLKSEVEDDHISVKLDMDCPPHDLGEAEVLIRISQSERIDE